MGIISRVASAPYQDGETLTGADLEGDFNTIYTEFNGAISTANIADNAISTSKIANGAVTQAKLDGTLVATVADGAVTTAKIADGAVTTVKIAATAVTQAKMTSGAATSSEVQYNSGTTNLSTSYATLGSSVNHVCGNPVRHVLIFVTLSMGLHKNDDSVTLKLIKDGGTLNSERLYQRDYGTAQVNTYVYRPATLMFVDTAPTAGGTHNYYLQGKRTGTGTSYVEGVSIAIFEPRS